MPVGWGRVPGHEVAFCDRLPFLLTTEVSVFQRLQPALKKQVIQRPAMVHSIMACMPGNHTSCVS